MQPNHGFVRRLRAVLLVPPSFLVFPLILGLLAQSNTTVHIEVTLVDADLNIKPVPRHALLMSRAGQGEVTRAVTGINGKVDVQLPPGEYTVKSERPVEFQGKSYTWSKNVTVADRDLTLELSVDSATVEQLPPASSRGGNDLPSLFKIWQNSVVTVWGETGHGSGFLIDKRGLIATNQHVVANFDYAAVQLDENTKLAARIVARSPERDVAILWVSAERVSSMQPVKLASVNSTQPPVVEGEQVFTIGSPLNQRKVMTTGIVSKMEARAIISDVNINHGNSGGPLFTMDGTVIGITTFLDTAGQGGPGISGIVRIEEAKPLLEQAENAMRSGEAPSPSLLPVEPNRPFPVEGLKELLRTRPINVKDYSTAAGDYDVLFLTPVVARGMEYQAEQASLKERSKRNSKAAAAPETMNPLSEFKNWEEYVGEYRPVVSVRARPKLAESFGSAFSRGMAAYYGYYGGPAKLHFKTDFFRMRVYCGRDEVVPIHPGKVEHRASANTAAVKVNDATYEGLYTFAPDVLGPHCGFVRLDIYSEKEPNKVAESTVVPAKIIQRIWDDFAPFRAANGKDTKH